MRRFRLLAASLLVTLCTGFSSCGDDEFVGHPIRVEGWTEEYLANYGIVPNAYEFFHCQYTRDWNFVALGLLSDQYLWMGVFDTLTYRQIYEIRDEEITEKKISKYVGYGEYEDLYLSEILPSGLAPTENGFIAQINLHYNDNNDRLKSRELLTFFSSNGLKKTTVTLSNDEMSTRPIRWYKDAAMVGSDRTWACCKDNGDTLYITKFPFNINDDFIAVSYTDLVVLGLNSYRMDVSKEEIATVWNAKVTPPFDVPSHTKYTITILENTSNIWKCRADFLYYDGMKKDYTFYLNIENGEISDTL